MKDDPRRITQEFLDRQSSAIINHDLEGYLQTVSLPYRALSLTHDALLENEDQVRTGLRTYYESSKALGVNLFYRKATAVRVHSDRYVEATYVSHHMRDATHMVPPYNCRQVLARHNDGWRMIESERQLVTHGWAADLNAVPADAQLPIAISMDDVRSKGIEPIDAYQAHLDAIAKAEINEDFETYISYLRFPHTTHSMQMDNVIESPEDIRPFFDMIRKTRNGDVGDHLERTAERAEFVGADLLVGYHTGRVFKNGVEAVEPVASRMILQWAYDRWQLLSVANTIRNKSYPFDMYAPGDELLTDIDIQKRTREWPSFLRKRTVTA